jgi:hypothetical protein
MGKGVSGAVEIRPSWTPSSHTPPVTLRSVDGNAVTLESTSVVGWRGSKEVLAISRRISLDGDVLTDALDMQAVGHDLQGHVVAELRRE